MQPINRDRRADYLDRHYQLCCLAQQLHPVVRLDITCLIRLLFQKLPVDLDAEQAEIFYFEVTGGGGRAPSGGRGKCVLYCRHGVCQRNAGEFNLEAHGAQIAFSVV